MGDGRWGDWGTGGLGDWETGCKIDKGGGVIQITPPPLFWSNWCRSSQFIFSWADNHAKHQPKYLEVALDVLQPRSVYIWDWQVGG